NTARLTPSVRAVPNSDHQRIASSQPRGKNSSPSAKIVGMKISSDIQIRSVSGMARLHRLGTFPVLVYVSRGAARKVNNPSPRLPFVGGGHLANAKLTKYDSMTNSPAAASTRNSM